MLKRYYIAGICLFFVLSVNLTALSQQVERRNDTKMYENPKMKEYCERLIEESKTIREKFNPIYAHLSKTDGDALNSPTGNDNRITFFGWDDRLGKTIPISDWDNDYFIPLFKAASQSMRKCTEAVDDRSALEFMMRNPISRQDCLNRYNGLCVVPFGLLNELALPQVFAASLTYERRNEIIIDTIYGEPERQKRQLKNWSGMSGEKEELIRRKNPYLSGTLLAPPMYPTCYGYPFFSWQPPTYDGLLSYLVLYSYKDERACDFFLELTASGKGAGWSEYFVTLLPSTDEFQEKVKALFEQIKKKDESTAVLFSPQGKLLNPFQRRSTLPYDAILCNGATVRQWEEAAKGVPTLFCLNRILRRLDFNKKLSREELKRFNRFRLELAISYALSCKTAHIQPHGNAEYQKGDERFEIYLTEYKIPCLVDYSSEDYDADAARNESHPYGSRRETYFEQELNNPIYTEEQRGLIREKLKTLKD